MFADSTAARVFRALLVAGMMACLGLAFLELVRLIAPTYAPWWLLPGVVLVALEAQASFFLSERLELRGRDWLTYRLIEMGMLVLLLRLLTLTDLSAEALWATLRRWTASPGAIFDLEFIVLLFGLMLLWLTVGEIAAELALLEWRPSDYDASGRLLRGEYARGDRSGAHQRLSQRFFMAGAGLLLMVGLPRAIGQSENGDSPVPAALILSTLGYFGLGLTLLSQAHLSRLRLEWLSQEFRLDPALGQRWRRWSIIFIALVACGAALLPTSYTGGLLGLAGTLLNLLITGLYLLGSGLLLLFIAPFALLFWLLSGTGEEVATGETPPGQLPAIVEPLLSGPPPAWLELARQFFFWGVLLFFVVYILRDYLITRGIWLTQLRGIPLVGPLLAWLAGLFGGLQTSGRRLASEVRQRLARAVTPAAPGAERWPRLRLRRLSPAERVRYFYLSHLRRAEEQGYPRAPHETPTTYASHLKPALGEEGPDWEALTDAFEQARYAPQPVTEGQVTQVRSVWERLKRALRTLH